MAAQGTRQVMSADDVRRAITRIGHEIVERNHGADGVVLVGLQRGGVWIARQLQASLALIDGAGEIPVGTPRRQLLPRRRRHATDRPRKRDRHPRARSTTPTWCSSMTCCSLGGRCVPRSTR